MMQNACPNPLCGAQYNLSPQHVGRQFACRKCGMMLLVDAEGIRPAEASLAPAAVPGAAAAPNLTAGSVRADAAEQLLGSMKGDVWTWVFGAGAVLVILFVFFPLLDSYRAMRMSAGLRMEELRQQKLASEANKKGGEAVKKYNDEKRKWEEDVRQPMEEALTEQTYEAGMNRWRDGWGMLVGFVLLAVGSIGWMRAGEGRIRKVVAAVVLCAMLLMVFIKVLGTSPSLGDIPSPAGRVIR